MTGSQASFLDRSGAGTDPIELWPESLEMPLVVLGQREGFSNRAKTA